MGSTGHSFVTGWGINLPAKLHHRGASCGYVQAPNSTLCDLKHWYALDKEEFPNLFYGALIGGPNLYEEWKDDYLDFVAREVALDYNAALLSGVILSVCWFTMDRKSAGTMNLPAYFWQSSDYYPRLPMEQMDFDNSWFKPIPGISVTRDHPSVSHGLALSANLLILGASSF